MNFKRGLVLCLTASMFVAQPMSANAASTSLASLGTVGLSASLDQLGTSGESITQALDKAEKENYTGLCIAKVNDYVNVRSGAGEEYDIVGKLYDKSVGDVESTEDGWYLINSGNVHGYVKKEYVVIGEEADELAETVGTRVATVTTETLRVRQDATTDSAILGLVPNGEELTVTDETEDFVKVSIEEGDGWVSKDYVELRTDYVYAESKEEEAARLEKEEEAKKEAKKAALAAAKKVAATNSSSSSSSSNVVVGSSSGSATGNAVASFASQFVGNPYVYGGTSLTNGADCSGFVMSVYANFGVSLPHSSSALRSVGYGVSFEEAQPGDIICYSGHVAIYVGNNTIVHASTAATGIKFTSPANYKTILAVRRIF